MSSDQLPVETARLVTPRALKGYVEGLGWQRVEGVNGAIAVYQNPVSPLRQMIVPLDRKLDDYGERAAEAIQKLAEFEKQPAAEILTHLLLPPTDLLRLQENGADADAGYLPLNHAVRLIRGARSALLSIAHSVLIPQAYHPRLSRGEAEEFVTRCRLLTERGSFVLALACPLDLPAGFLFAPKIDPFARRVTSLFMQSLRDLAQAADTVEARAADALADVHLHPGMSANFCEALLLLRPQGERSTLSVSATWSRAYLPASREGRREIKIDQQVFEVAEALAPRLRSLPEPRIDRFYGYVNELRGNPTPSDPRPSGEVRFTLFEQDEELHARAELDAHQYGEAIAAHAATDLVSFKGILQRLPRLNRIERVSEFKRFRLDEEEHRPPARILSRE